MSGLAHQQTEQDWLRGDASITGHDRHPLSSHDVDTHKMNIQVLIIFPFGRLVKFRAEVERPLSIVAKGSLAWTIP